MAHNDITGDSIATGKGSYEKYAEGWEGIFGKKHGPCITISTEGITFPTVDGKSMGFNTNGGLWFKGLSDAEYENIRLGLINTGRMIAERDRKACMKYFHKDAEGNTGPVVTVEYELPTPVMALDFHDSVVVKAIPARFNSEDDGAREAWEDAWRGAVMRKG